MPGSVPQEDHLNLRKNIKKNYANLLKKKNDHTLNELVELMGNVAKKINYKPLSYFNGILI